jgi:hypothetical protein
MPEIVVQQPVEGLGGAVDEHGTPPIPVPDGNELVEGFKPGIPSVDGVGLTVPMVDGNELVPIVDRLGVGTTTNGLIPALFISTEPNGIPDRAVPAGDADDDEPMLLELVPQIADVAALPGNDVPIPIPVPPPSNVLEPDIPDDELPVAEHVVPFPVIPMVPLVAGLSPGDASSIAPMGIPVGATDEPGVMPNGEVAAIPGDGVPTPPTCANTGLLPNSAASSAVVNTRRIMISIVMTQRTERANRSTSPTLVDLIGRCLLDLADFVAGLLHQRTATSRLEINRWPARTIKLPFRKLNSISCEWGGRVAVAIGASTAAKHKC